jgi:hypothetical protein
LTPAFIDFDTFKCIGTALSSSDTIATSITGNRIEVIGTIRCRIECGNDDEMLEFLVLKQSIPKFILGIDF